VTQNQSQVEILEKSQTKIQPPKMFDVIFYNDAKTYFEFVVLVLMQFFNKDLHQATDLTHSIHQKGRAPVATYTYEVAAAKRDETVATARANGHPLRVEIEASLGEQP